MSVEIFIYSSQPLGFSKSEVEDDIDEMLGDVGEVTGSGSGQAGWNIDIEIYDPENVTKAQVEIINILKNRKVPKDTYLQMVGSGRVNVY